jgi:hypothetical protein
VLGAELPLGVVTWTFNPEPAAWAPVTAVICVPSLLTATLVAAAPPIVTALAPLKY